MKRDQKHLNQKLANFINPHFVCYLRFREDRDAKVEKYRHEGSMGKAAIGGPFKLTAHDGKPFDSEVRPSYMHNCTIHLNFLLFKQVLKT